MAAISSAMLAAAASEEEESAESILERHMSQCSVFSGPDAHDHAHSASSSGVAQQRATRAASRPDSYAARHAHSSMLTHSRSAVEGGWSLSDHRCLSDHPPSTFRTSASFGDGDLSRPHVPEPSGPDRDRATVAATNLVVSGSRHHQQRPPLSCSHTEADRKWESFVWFTLTVIV